MSTQRVYVLLLLCVLFWSGNFILGRFVSLTIEPLELAFFRWFFVVLLLIPVLFIIDIKKIFVILKKHFFVLCVLALLGITFFNTFLYIALQTTTATNALLLNSIIPILILVFSVFILKNRINIMQTIGILLSTFGVVFLVLKGNIFNLANINFIKGDFWLLASSFAWAIYSTLLKFKPKNLTHLELFVTIVFLGFLFLIPFYLVQGYSLEHELQILRENWYFFIYVSVFTSLLSFYFWHIGIDEIGAEKTGQFTHLMPVFGTILAFILLDEKLELFHLIGASFIAVGIYLSLFIRKNKNI